MSALRHVTQCFQRLKNSDVILFMSPDTNFLAIKSFAQNLAFVLLKIKRILLDDDGIYPVTGKTCKDISNLLYEVVIEVTSFVS